MRALTVGIYGRYDPYKYQPLRAGPALVRPAKAVGPFQSKKLWSGEPARLLRFGLHSVPNSSSSPVYVPSIQSNVHFNGDFCLIAAKHLVASRRPTGEDSPCLGDVSIRARAIGFDNITRPRNASVHLKEDRVVEVPSSPNGGRDRSNGRAARYARSGKCVRSKGNTNNQSRRSNQCNARREEVSKIKGHRLLLRRRDRGEFANTRHFLLHRVYIIGPWNFEAHKGLVYIRDVAFFLDNANEILRNEAAEVKPNNGRIDCGVICKETW